MTKKVLLLLIAAFILTATARSQTLVAHTAFTGATGGGTSPSINTTGATFIIVCFSSAGGGTAITSLSDSASNVWPAGAWVEKSGPSAAPFTTCIVLGPPLTTSSSHTFTVSGGSQFISFTVQAWSGIYGGVASPIKTNGSSTTSCAPGSITPSSSFGNILIISAVATTAATTGSQAITGGFTITDQVAWTSNNYSSASAYLVQSSASAVNPSWSWTGSATTSCETLILYVGNGSTPALVDHTSFGGATGGGTSGSINTTGASLLVICAGSQNNPASALTVSDSKSNSWAAWATIFTFPSGPPWTGCISAGPPLTVGSGHTFTVTGSSTFTAFTVMAFSGIPNGVSSMQSTSATGSTGCTPGSITPTSSIGNILLISAETNNASSGGTQAVDHSFNLTDKVDFGSGNHYAIASAYLVQTSAAATNPAWTWNNSASTSCENLIFYAGKSASGTPTQPWVIN